MVEYCESFPEVTRDIKVGLPSELLPLWHVGWTMASFDGHEVVASPTTAGQMSRNVVYKARQGDEHFAIKKYEGDANTLRTCLHEATLLVRMQHPHVAKLVGLFEDASAFHLIMPFYSHGRLDVWVRDREARLAVAVFACVRALRAHAHVCTGHTGRAVYTCACNGKPDSTFLRTRAM